MYSTILMGESMKKLLIIVATLCAVTLDLAASSSSQGGASPFSSASSSAASGGVHAKIKAAASVQSSTPALPAHGLGPAQTVQSISEASQSKKDARILAQEIIQSHGLRAINADTFSDIVQKINNHFIQMLGTNKERAQKVIDEFFDILRSETGLVHSLEFPKSSSVACLAISADWIAVASKQKELFVWRRKDQNLHARMPLGTIATCLTISSDNKYIVCGREKSIQVYDLSDPKQLTIAEEIDVNCSVKNVKFLPSVHEIVFLDQQGTVYRKKLLKKETPVIVDQDVKAIAFTDLNNFVALARKNYVQIKPMDDFLKPQAGEKEHADSIPENAIKFRHDVEHIAVANDGNKLVCVVSEPDSKKNNDVREMQAVKKSELHVFQKNKRGMWELSQVPIILEGRVKYLQLFADQKSVFWTSTQGKSFINLLNEHESFLDIDDDIIKNTRMGLAMGYYCDDQHIIAIIDGQLGIYGTHHIKGWKKEKNSSYLFCRLALFNCRTPEEVIKLHKIYDAEKKLIPASLLKEFQRDEEYFLKKASLQLDAKSLFAQHNESHVKPHIEVLNSRPHIPEELFIEKQAELYAEEIIARLQVYSVKNVDEMKKALKKEIEDKALQIKKDFDDLYQSSERAFELLNARAILESKCLEVLRDGRLRENLFEVQRDHRVEIVSIVSSENCIFVGASDGEITVCEKKRHLDKMHRIYYKNAKLNCMGISKGKNAYIAFGLSDISNGTHWIDIYKADKIGEGPIETYTLQCAPQRLELSFDGTVLACVGSNNVLSLRNINSDAILLVENGIIDAHFWGQSSQLMFATKNAIFNLTENNKRQKIISIPHSVTGFAISQDGTKIACSTCHETQLNSNVPRYQMDCYQKHNTFQWNLLQSKCDIKEPIHNIQFSPNQSAILYLSDCVNHWYLDDELNKKKLDVLAVAKPEPISWLVTLCYLDNQHILYGTKGGAIKIRHTDHILEFSEGANVTLDYTLNRLALFNCENQEELQALCKSTATQNLVKLISPSVLGLQWRREQKALQMLLVASGQPVKFNSPNKSSVLKQQHGQSSSSSSSSSAAEGSVNSAGQLNPSPPKLSIEEQRRKGEKDLMEAIAASMEGQREIAMSGPIVANKSAQNQKAKNDSSGNQNPALASASSRSLKQQHGQSSSSSSSSSAVEGSVNREGQFNPRSADFLSVEPDYNEDEALKNAITASMEDQHGKAMSGPIVANKLAQDQNAGNDSSGPIQNQSPHHGIAKELAAASHSSSSSSSSSRSPNRAPIPLEILREHAFGIIIAQELMAINADNFDEMFDKVSLEIISRVRSLTGEIDHPFVKKALEDQIVEILHENIDSLRGFDSKYTINKDLLKETGIFEFMLCCIARLNCLSWTEEFGVETVKARQKMRRANSSNILTDKMQCMGGRGHYPSRAARDEINNKILQDLIRKFREPARIVVDLRKPEPSDANRGLITKPNQGASLSAGQSDLKRGVAAASSLAVAPHLLQSQNPELALASNRSRKQQQSASSSSASSSSAAVSNAQHEEGLNARNPDGVMSDEEDEDFKRAVEASLKNQKNEKEKALHGSLMVSKSAQNPKAKDDSSGPIQNASPKLASESHSSSSSSSSSRSPNRAPIPLEILREHAFGIIIAQELMAINADNFDEMFDKVSLEIISRVRSLTGEIDHPFVKKALEDQIVEILHENIDSLRGFDSKYTINKDLLKETGIFEFMLCCIARLNCLSWTEEFGVETVKARQKMRRANSSNILTDKMQCMGGRGHYPSRAARDEINNKILQDLIRKFREPARIVVHLRKPELSDVNRGLISKQNQGASLSAGQSDLKRGVAAAGLPALAERPQAHSINPIAAQQPPVVVHMLAAPPQAQPQASFVQRPIFARSSHKPAKSVVQHKAHENDSNKQRFQKAGGVAAVSLPAVASHPQACPIELIAAQPSPAAAPVLAIPQQNPPALVIPAAEPQVRMPEGFVQQSSEFAAPPRKRAKSAVRHRAHEDDNNKQRGQKAESWQDFLQAKYIIPTVIVAAVAGYCVWKYVLQESHGKYSKK